MRMWILSFGTCHEGGEPIGVYSTREKAIEAAKKVPVVYEAPRYSGRWNPIGEDMWENECMYLSIDPLELDAPPTR